MTMNYKLQYTVPTTDKRIPTGVWLPVGQYLSDCTRIEKLSDVHCPPKRGLSGSSSSGTEGATLHRPLNLVESQL